MSNNTSNDKSYQKDRPIWLTSLAEADREVTPASAIGSRLETALRRRRHAIQMRRLGIAGIAAVLGLVLWLPPKQTSVAAFDPMDESVSDAITEAMNKGGDDEVDFVPTTLAAEQPLESVRMVRVSLPSGELASYGVAREGVPASGEVTADLLVGQDGIARAIRVVK